MLGRDLRIQREIELAEAAALPPFAQMVADAKSFDAKSFGAGSFHAVKIVQGARHLHYLPVNRPADHAGLDDGTGAVMRRTKQTGACHEPTETPSPLSPGCPR